MKKPTFLFSTVGVAAMFLLLVAFNSVSARFKQRIDLTAEKAYTLSKGTREILGRLDTPVQVRLYCTQNDSAMPVFLKTYAQRVEDLLDEYRQASKGRIEIKKLNPEPDSDAEDSAKLDGVEGQMLPTGEKIYLGLSINLLDSKEAIPFLTPERERLLEYDLSRAIGRVLTTERPVIGVMSPLSPLGSSGPQMMQMMQMGQRGQSPWVFINELKRDFAVREIEIGAEAIPADIKELVLIHPKTLPPATQYAIDQFVVRGGKLVAFLDSSCVLDRQAAPMMGSSSQSSLEPLLGAWGVTFNQNQVLADLSFLVRTREGRSATVLALTDKAVNRQDIVTADADNLVMIYAGVFGGTPAEGLTRTVLLHSSKDSQLVEPMSAQMSGEEVISNFVSSGTEHPLAIRLSGKFKSAFPNGRPGADPSAPKQETPSAEGTVVLIGDADMIQDQIAVTQMNNPFGQPMIVPANGNLAFAQAVVEQLAGDSSLISIRSRASRERPFSVVKEMQANAELAFRSKIKEMEAGLANAEGKLNELQQAKGDGQRFILSPEQQREIEKFRAAEAQIRKDLKLERKKLRKGIDSLENRIKWINIAAMPAAVALAGLAFAGIQRKRVTAK